MVDVRIDGDTPCIQSCMFYQFRHSRLWIPSIFYESDGSKSLLACNSAALFFRDSSRHIRLHEIGCV